MQAIGKLFISGGAAALTAALCGLLTFVILALFDSTSFGEALAFGLVVGFLTGIVGFFIGVVVRVTNVGLIGAALIGLAAILVLVAGYVLIFSRPGQYAYFLSESRVIVLIAAFPAIASALVAGLLNRSME